MLSSGRMHCSISNKMGPYCDPVNPFFLGVHIGAHPYQQALVRSKLSLAPGFPPEKTALHCVAKVVSSIDVKSPCAIWVWGCIVSSLIDPLAVESGYPRKVHTQDLVQMGEDESCWQEANQSNTSAQTAYVKDLWHETYKKHMQYVNARLSGEQRVVLNVFLFFYNVYISDVCLSSLLQRIGIP